MWTYAQRTGALTRDDGMIVAVGYSGAGAGKNNPDAQDLHDVGPLPRGHYFIEPPVDTRTHGPFVLWLDPDVDNVMYGRSGFGIHGDSVIHPGMASEGCIVLPRAIREQIWNSGDHRLTVTS